MLRRSLLFLSERKGLRDRLLRVPAARATAHRFVAGEGLDEALDVASGLEARGFRVTLDHLGESVGTEGEAEAATSSYETTFARIRARGIESTISLKLTQLGLDLDRAICVSNLERILAAADRCGSFVRIDMEGSDYTEATLDVFHQVFPRHRNVGVVIQSYLLRSERDIEDLAREGAHVRLCKGAYKEPPSLAYPRKADIDANYVHLARHLLDAARDRPAVGGVPPVGIATHDDEMIEATRGFVESRAIPIDAFEFQMLYGVRAAYQEELLKEGYHVRIYVPYGTE